MATLDTLGRPLEALRISVTDRCNFRCTYCMPKEAFAHHSFLEPSQLLTFEEIAKLSEIFVGLGVGKIRLTGGEPLLRPGIEELVRLLTARLPDIELALSTNGALLRPHAASLRAAGLRRINISLDAIDDLVFGAINGVNRPAAAVLDGIDAAIENGFDTKVNMVVEKGVNDLQILPMARHFASLGLPLRFIEFMDVGNCNEWERQRVVPGAEIQRILSTEFDLEREKGNASDVERRYVCRRTGARFGFIDSVTVPFCRDCNRLRLSADGAIYTCLFARDGQNLGQLLRAGCSDEKITEIVRQVWNLREDRYSELRTLSNSKSSGPKVEMSYIGG